MSTLTETQNAYKEILDAVNKYKDICNYDVYNMECKAKWHLWGLELNEKYGLNINPRDVGSEEYVRVDDHRFIGMYGEKYRRTISWLDEGEQPEGEMLLSIGFSTGAYIFGREYYPGLFDEFFTELMSYNPKYSDTHNHNLYFSLENASGVFNDFKSILKKYCDKYKVYDREFKIKKMSDELEKLKSSE